MLIERLRIVLFLLPLCSTSLDALREHVPRQGGQEVLPTRSLLRWERPSYGNFAFEQYANYPNHFWPYEDTPRALYDPFGNHVITGFDSHQWLELRTPGLSCASPIRRGQKCGSLVQGIGTVVARDSHGEWGYAAVIGQNGGARLSPLTVSMSSFNGFRVDLTSRHLDTTILGSRIDRPDGGQVDDANLLLGSRVQVRVGALQIGLNGGNIHSYQSTKSGNSVKGRLHSDQPIIDWIVVRFEDDSPADGTGGAVVQSAQLIVNGKPRPDLVPEVIRHQSGIQTQVGRRSAVTERFLGFPYASLGQDNLAQSAYYSNQTIPLFADYFYRLDHERGRDVAPFTNLRGLLSNLQLPSLGEILIADGGDQLNFLFNMSDEPMVESVSVDALLAGDYRVSVATISQKSTSERWEHRFRSTFLKTILRAPGNVQDGTNLERRRFDIGEHTSIFTYSSDVTVEVPGLSINAEYAGSTVWSRYPASLSKPNRQRVFDQGRRFADRGSAYFINAVHWSEYGHLGAEYYSMHPSFQTNMRNYTHSFDNKTAIWRLVEDNEDADHYADYDYFQLDPTGVLLDQDTDRDGIPDSNRNLNDLLDYEEPFLAFHADPDAYVYGLDRNHNDEPDRREDDIDPDYPYDFDQKGFHIFGQINLTPHWGLASGHFSIRELAGAGRNRATYLLMTYRRENPISGQRLNIQNHFRRVKDNIPDEYLVLGDVPRRLLFSVRRRRRYDYRLLVASDVREDPLRYQNSYVNEFYADARFRPLASLSLDYKLRYRSNWQRVGRSISGNLQRERRLDFLTLVSRTEFTKHFYRARFTLQHKLMLLRDVDRTSNLVLRSEIESMPIVRVEFPLTSRTALRFGVQGIGPLPHRALCTRCGQFGKTNSFSRRNPASFKQHTLIASVNNRSQYSGYELHTVIGFEKSRKRFDRSLYSNSEFDSWAFFVRALVGFGMYAQLL